MVDHPATLALRREKKPLIYAFWHDQQVFLARHHRNEPIHVMVSRSKDGEYIAQIMKRLGVFPIRGSSSRGGAQAFREIIDVLKDGKQAGFTPDGPRGPVYSVHDGVVKAAQLSGVPIVPLACRSRREIRFNSWDKFRVPLPFSTIVVSHGQPLTIRPDEDETRAKERVKAALFKTESMAEQGLAGAPSWGESVLGNTLQGLYLILGWILFPVWAAAAVVIFGWKRSARHAWKRFGRGTIAESSLPRLWFHAASLGEWQALRPLLKKFETQKNYSLFVTTSTPEAEKIISQQEPEVPVSLLPLDLWGVMDRYLRKVKPTALVLVETELWPHLIGCCRDRRVPVFLVNGRLSASSVRGWTLLRPLVRRFLQSMSWYFIRSESDGKNFFTLKAPLTRMSVTGNLKNDNLKIWSWEEKLKRRTELFSQADGVLFAAGSTWPGEEAAALDWIKKPVSKKVRLILAPRRPERFKDVEQMLQTQNVSFSRWSMVKSVGNWNTDVLMVDTLGDLKDLYAVADVAFLGGSLYPRGGQNPLEPAAARVALMFGPNMQNFKDEVKDFNKSGASRQGRSSQDLAIDFIEIVEDENLRRSMAEAAAGVVKLRQGAVQRTAESLASLLGFHLS